jgi:hypothetical protein
LQRIPLASDFVGLPRPRPFLQPENPEPGHQEHGAAAASATSPEQEAAASKAAADTARVAAKARAQAAAVQVRADAEEAAREARLDLASVEEWVLARTQVAAEKAARAQAAADQPEEPVAGEEAAGAAQDQAREEAVASGAQAAQEQVGEPAAAEEVATARTPEQEAQLQALVLEANAATRASQAADQVAELARQRAEAAGAKRGPKPSSQRGPASGTP